MTIADLSDMGAEDWPRLGLPVKLEKVLRACRSPAEMFATQYESALKEDTYATNTACEIVTNTPNLA